MADPHVYIYMPANSNVQAKCERCNPPNTRRSGRSVDPINADPIMPIQNTINSVPSVAPDAALPQAPKQE